LRKRRPNKQTRSSETQDGNSLKYEEILFRMGFRFTVFFITFLIGERYQTKKYPLQEEKSANVY